MLYEVQLWGCVSALLGLPAELNPQMFVLVPDDVCNYTSHGGACQQFFAKFFAAKDPRRAGARRGSGSGEALFL